MFRTIWILLLLLTLAGCQSLAPRRAPPPAAATSALPSVSPAPLAAEPAAAEPSPIPPAVPEAPPPDEPPSTPPGLWAELVAGYRLQDQGDPAIEKELTRYQRRLPDLERQLARGEPWLPHILQEVERRGLPTELALLPCIESGFRPTARSHRGAAGLWQFMPGTGRALGLEQDWWYDARRDPIRSTRAALDYLEQLHRRFGGDWLLALAAYNAGRATVLRAIRYNEAHDRPIDFWSLRLPRETRRYVPRLLALSRMIAEADRYQLALPQIDPTPRYAQVTVEGQLDLKVAAELADMEVKELFRLNPGFNRWATHPHQRHRLLLPADRVERFQRRLAQLPPEKRVRMARYRVRSGDTLSHIALRFGVSVRAIRQANRLRSSHIRAGQSLIIPLSGGSSGLAQASPAAHQGFRYRVRKGDSLWTIARRFGVHIRDLQRWNRLAGQLLRPGQTLTIRSL